MAALASVIAGVALWGWLCPARPEARPVTRFTMALPAGNPSWRPSLSRDGSRLAFPWGNPSRLYLRMMDQLETKTIPGTEGATHASFSPDGQWIGFLTREPNGRQLKKIPVAGGAALTLADNIASGFQFLSWGEDDNILFATLEGGLLRVPASGGRPQTLATPNAGKGEFYAAPQLLPGGKQVLFTIGGPEGGLQRSI